MHRIIFRLLELEKKNNMDNLPNDPMMLMSFINMKLRDEYSSLDELCTSLNIEKETLIKKLNASGTKCFVLSHISQNNRYPLQLQFLLPL